jgi:hypothetical protein
MRSIFPHDVTVVMDLGAMMMSDDGAFVLYTMILVSHSCIFAVHFSFHDA